MSKWKTYSPLCLNCVANSIGVYCIYVSGRLVRVGKSKGLKSRIRSYFFWTRGRMPKCKLGQRAHVKIKARIMGDFVRAGLLEAELIHRLKPAKNKTDEKFFRSIKVFAKSLEVEYGKLVISDLKPR